MAWYSSTLLFILSMVVTARSSAFIVSLSPFVTTKSSTTTTSTSMASSVDTPEKLPEFSTAEEYLDYIKSASKLPKGFATGTADGSFIAVEAPGLGNLKIRATVIQLTGGPTENWAACFTSNKVGSMNMKITCLRRILGEHNLILVQWFALLFRFILLVPRSSY